MKKILLSLLVVTMCTTVALADENTVDYNDTTYVYGGQATETTDDNENGRLDGLNLRGVEDATYYTAGDGFAYFIPATEDIPAKLILDNATFISDYCIQATTDVDLTLVGDNFLQSTGIEYSCFNAVDAYDSNLELLEYQDFDYCALTIDGDGSLQVISTGPIAFNVGQFALHSGDISITLEDSSAIAIKTDSNYETNELPGFLMDGGTLDIVMSQYSDWGIEVASGDIIISDGTLTISGGTYDGTGLLASVYTKDVVVAITGGTTIIENNGDVSFGTVKFSEDVTTYTVIDFTDNPDGIFAINNMLHFFDVLEVCAETGTVDISGFDGVGVYSAPQLIVTGLSDYMYCVNEFTTYELSEQTLLSFTANMVGQPAITAPIRYGLLFPYTSENNIDVTFTFTRAQIIALLWDSLGCPEATMDNPFTDINPDDEYYEAILWATEQNITTGTTATTFDPDSLCTKGQLLTFLYRNAGQPEIDITNIFADVDEDSYLYNAVLWGIANSMMDVNSETFSADITTLNDGAIAYLLCMYQ
ncbi:MAG: S-layer homology domain-containing protein [Clostridia bacterium]